jgi:hypothetical protein
LTAIANMLKQGKLNLEENDDIQGQNLEELLVLFLF